jgi:hypothetical protein
LKKTTRDAYQQRIMQMAVCEATWELRLASRPGIKLRKPAATETSKPFVSVHEAMRMGELLAVLKTNAECPKC